MPDVGRFFNVDPLAEDYAYQSPYNFAENQVIAFVELEGLEKGLPWYLNENKQGGKPVLTLGAHNIKLPYAQRSEYKGNIILKADTFIGNTLGSIYNSVASSWNEAMEGKTAGQMAQEGDRDMETTLNDISRNGVKMEHIEGLAAVALIHKAGGKMSNKLTPNKEAVGDHSSYSRDKSGNIYKYETYEKTKTGHFNPTKRFDGGKPDGSSGNPHIDKKSGQSVTTPHVQDKSGNARKPTNDELPRNKRFN